MTPDQKIARLKKALHYAGDYHTWEDVVAKLNSGQAQIFDVDEGCAVTEIIQLPRKRYLNCWLVGGRLPAVLDLVPAMERHGLANNCSDLMAFGRRGWERILPQRGWKITGSTFLKELKNAE
jgi:hypothetical protein